MTTESYQLHSTSVSPNSPEKSTSIGGRDHACRCVVRANSASAVKVHSCWPCMRGIFHKMWFSPGTYFALPTPTLHSTLVVLRGVGIFKTTLFAFSFASNVARNWIVYSTRDFVGSTTCAWRRKGRLMLDVERYRMSSNSPSGGIKLMDRSESNLPNLTH